MKPSTIHYALVLSLLLNLGVITAAGYQAWHHGGIPITATTAIDLPDYLKLTAGQRERWHALEPQFLKEVDAGWAQIRAHRERLIREIFSEAPDRDRIEAERAGIAELQKQEQQRVIAQFLKERDILDAEQRRSLAELLLREAPSTPFERRLHTR